MDMCSTSSLQQPCSAGYIANNLAEISDGIYPDFTILQRPTLWALRQPLQHGFSISISTTSQRPVRYCRMVSQVPELLSILPRPRAAQRTRASSFGLCQHTITIPKSLVSVLFLPTRRVTHPPPGSSLCTSPECRTSAVRLSHTIYTKASSHWA